MCNPNGYVWDRRQKQWTRNDPGKQGYTSDWDKSDRKICGRFFSALQQDDPLLHEQAGEDLTALIQEKLQRISEDTQPEHAFLSEPLVHKRYQPILSVSTVFTVIFWGRSADPATALLAIS